MTDEKNNEYAMKIAYAWNKHLETLDKKFVENLFSDYKNYLDEYSKFVSSYKIKD